MYALMCYQTALTTECLITHVTWIRTLTAMYSLMCYQTALLTECLITHITWIWLLPLMYALMCYHTTLLTEFLCTHITSVGHSPLCMRWCFIRLLFSQNFFTHFTNIQAFTAMIALMSYQTTLLTEFLLTHFASIWPLIPMYITRISAFSTLYMKFFIHSTLAKTQRLNIRTYSDKKNNYFYSNVEV